MVLIATVSGRHPDPALVSLVAGCSGRQALGLQAARVASARCVLVVIPGSTALWRQLAQLQPAFFRLTDRMEQRCQFNAQFGDVALPG